MTKKPLRKPGWIGTRIEVCGRNFGTLICTLPPNHNSHFHASVAIDENDTIVTLIYNEAEGTISWLDSQ